MRRAACAGQRGLTGPLKCPAFSRPVPGARAPGKPWGLRHPKGRGPFFAQSPAAPAACAGRAGRRIPPILPDRGKCREGCGAAAGSGSFSVNQSRRAPRQSQDAARRTGAAKTDRTGKHAPEAGVSPRGARTAARGPDPLLPGRKRAGRTKRTGRVRRTACKARARRRGGWERIAVRTAATRTGGAGRGAHGTRCAPETGQPQRTARKTFPASSLGRGRPAQTAALAASGHRTAHTRCAAHRHGQKILQNFSVLHPPSGNLHKCRRGSSMEPAAPERTACASHSGR